MQEESLEKEKASKLAFLLRENKELQSELSLLMQQQLGTQFACFTGTKVQILTPEVQHSTERRSNCRRSVIAKRESMPRRSPTGGMPSRHFFFCDSKARVCRPSLQFFFFAIARREYGVPTLSQHIFFCADAAGGGAER
jgi:hypothetical protein